MFVGVEIRSIAYARHPSEGWDPACFNNVTYPKAGSLPSQG